VSIITGLRMSLDKEKGGEIAENLDDLYDYMNRRIMEGAQENDVSKLTEVTSLLLEIKSGWDAIGDQVSPVDKADQATRTSITESA
jgi:flagellar protein FliS